MRKSNCTVVNTHGMKFRRVILTLTIGIMASFMFSNCAVIFGGSKYNAQIQSTDPEADIYLYGMKRGTGNARLLVKRQDNLNLELRKDGCEDVHLTYPNKVRATFALNLLSWGLVGIIVDFATGATYKPDTDTPGVTQLNQKTFQYIVKYECEEEE